VIEVIDLMCYRLREVTEVKRPMQMCQMTASSPGSIDMNPVVKLTAQSGIQSSSADGHSKRHKRKLKVLQENGSIDDMHDVKEKHNCSLDNCDENIQRKKRKRLTPSEPADSIMTVGEEIHDAAIASEPTVDDADSDAVLNDEVEIWIPNKKYRGPLRDVYAKMAGEGSRKMKHKKDDGVPFMTFIPVDKTPAALVRRRNKLSHSEPKQLHKSVSFMSICDHSILLGSAELSDV